jgi:hypothetical protein
MKIAIGPAIAALLVLATSCASPPSSPAKTALAANPVRMSLASMTSAPGVSAQTVFATNETVLVLQDTANSYGNNSNLWYLFARARLDTTGATGVVSVVPLVSFNLSHWFYSTNGTGVLPLVVSSSTNLMPCSLIGSRVLPFALTNRMICDFGWAYAIGTNSHMFTKLQVTD